VFVLVSMGSTLTFVAHRVLIAAVRDKGLCPCPRCLVPKAKVDKIGYLQDSRDRIKKARSYSHDLITRARDFVYKLGFNVKSAAIDRLLKSTSLVPTYVSCFAVTRGVMGLKPNITEYFRREAGGFGI
jgi:hypothetical protein